MIKGNITLSISVLVLEFISVACYILHLKGNLNFFLLMSSDKLLLLDTVSG